MTPRLAAGLGAAALAILLTAPARAALVGGYVGTLGGPTAAFTAAEADAGVSDPVRTTAVAGYGPVTIRFASSFAGQSYAYDPATQPIPARGPGTPAGPLVLAADPHLGSLVQYDAADVPVLAGSIDGSFGAVGPIAIWFSVPLVAVELTLQGFPDFGSTRLEAFAADGTSLGTLAYALNGAVTFDLTATRPIAGLSIGAETTGNPNLAEIVGVGLFAAPGAQPIPAPGVSALILAAVLAGHRRRGRQPPSA